MLAVALAEVEKMKTKPILWLSLTIGIILFASWPVQARQLYLLEIQTNQTVSPFTPLLLGSNTPAWLGPYRYENTLFRTRTQHSGLRYLRIPGGSWSDIYGWLSCEMRTYRVGNAQPCGVDGFDLSSWITRPTDFINFLKATDMQAIYVVNVNASAQEAAALVAFFNGHPDDTRPIGIDRYGQDWLTVGHWAQLRADHGNPEPFRIEYWEFGNEVYGAKPSKAGPECASWGWEDAWTCDGSEYIFGDAEHDGYLQVRAAMLNVDPTIKVGVVGYEDTTSYNEWGRKVLEGAGHVMDFYSIHPYPYGAPPPDTPEGWAEILNLPSQQLTAIKQTLQNAFNAYANSRQIPIAITEYNLTYSFDLDTQQMLNKSGNLLFLAEAIGQAMQHGYYTFNQWDLSNGCSYVTGSCYDMLLADSNFQRQPQYYAFVLWSRFGTQTLAVNSNVPSNFMSIYAGRNGTFYTLLAINKTGNYIIARIKLSGNQSIQRAWADVIETPSLSSPTIFFNATYKYLETSLQEIPDNLKVPSRPVRVTRGEVIYTFSPYSITLLTLK